MNEIPQKTAAPVMVEIQTRAVFVLEPTGPKLVSLEVLEYAPLALLPPSLDLAH